MSKAPKTAKSAPPQEHSVEATGFHHGDTIPRTGLYKVEHSEHRLPAQVTLRKGEIFPPCSACDASVLFSLLKAAPAESDDKVFKVVLYSLPVLDDDALAG